MNFDKKAVRAGCDCRFGKYWSHFPSACAGIAESAGLLGAVGGIVNNRITQLLHLLNGCHVVDQPIVTEKCAPFCKSYFFRCHRHESSRPRFSSQRERGIGLSLYLPVCPFVHRHKADRSVCIEKQAPGDSPQSRRPQRPELAGAIGLIETGFKNQSNISLCTNIDKSIRNIQAAGFAFNNARSCHYE